MTEDYGTLRIAVVSDLHVQDVTDTAAESHITTRSPRDDDVVHPVSSLISMITAEHLQADLLLVCGDMGNRADAAAIVYAWEETQRLAAALGSARVVATVGNHDIDSRHLSESIDPVETLKNLSPSFPTDMTSLNTQYWAYHYAIVEGSTYRVVTLNSAAYHGNPKELLHGRVIPNTVNRLTRELARLERKPAQILICHHHPHRFGLIDVGDYSEMQGGQYLLEELGSGTYGSWLVIHGHKHMPRLGYAAGGAGSAVIFSAGSLAASLFLELQTRARNQFYLLEMRQDAVSSIHLPLAGVFRAWDWVDSAGWQPAQPGSGLPQAGGFGFRLNADLAAAEIRRLIGLSKEPWLEWSEILDSQPQLLYLIPADVEALRRALSVVNVVADDTHGQITKVGLAQ